MVGLYICLIFILRLLLLLVGFMNFILPFVRDYEIAPRRNRVFLDAWSLVAKVKICMTLLLSGFLFIHMGVSKNKGTPKWMVYNGQPY